jgi:hypothetical protein
MRQLLLLLLLLPAGAAADALDHLQTRDDIGLNKIPHRGESHILVIPMRSGVAAFPADRLATLSQTFRPEGGPGTFRDYWRITSNGRYDPIPTLAQPVLYPSSCPLPGRTPANCKVTLDDLALISNHGLRDALVDILTRVRDEQGLDLSQFDVNTASGAGQDGFFDGVVLDSDIYKGIAFPLAALDNQASIAIRPGGPSLTVGIVAMVPPNLHEFGHLFGFMDLYGGPTLNCLMADTRATLSAYSRQQIEWGDVWRIDAPSEFDLKPVLDGGPVLRIGSGPTYLMVENRGGDKHRDLESSKPGINIYSIDERELPVGPLGFLDIASQKLYLPNAKPPYLNVNLPVGCAVGDSDGDGGCILANEGSRRGLVHQSGDATGLSLRLGATQADGTIHVVIDHGGCQLARGGSAPSAWPIALLLAIAAAAVAARRSAATAGSRSRRSPGRARSHPEGCGPRARSRSRAP